MLFSWWASLESRSRQFGFRHLRVRSAARCLPKDLWTLPLHKCPLEVKNLGLLHQVWRQERRWRKRVHQLWGVFVCPQTPGQTPEKRMLWTQGRKTIWRRMLWSPIWRSDCRHYLRNNNSHLRICLASRHRHMGIRRTLNGNCRRNTNHSWRSIRHNSPINSLFLLVALTLRTTSLAYLSVNVLWQHDSREQPKGSEQNHEEIQYQTVDGNVNAGHNEKSSDDKKNVQHEAHDSPLNIEKHVLQQT